jgi:hypothetical protein
MALVVRDAWSPEHDPVRSDGFPEHADDPGGGVLDSFPGHPEPQHVPGIGAEPLSR